MHIQPFEHPETVARLAGEEFSTAEMQRALGVSSAVWDDWTRGQSRVALIAPKGRGKAGRSFPAVDLWTMAIYKRLVALTNAAAPMKAALARFLEDHLFAELTLPETHEYLTWREANPGKPTSQFKPKLKRTKADLDWHREAIRACVAIDPFEAPALWWARDFSRPWYIVIDLDMLAADVAALKSGGELCPLTVTIWCDIPEEAGGLDLRLPVAALLINATDYLSEMDKRLIAIIEARGGLKP